MARPPRCSQSGGKRPLGAVMRRILSGICTAALTGTFLLVGPVFSAHATDPGHESYAGKLVVKSDASGNRIVLASVVRMQGVVTGVGHIVERDVLQGDPEIVN